MYPANSLGMKRLPEQMVCEALKKGGLPQLPPPLSDSMSHHHRSRDGSDGSPVFVLNVMANDSYWNQNYFNVSSFTKYTVKPSHLPSSMWTINNNVTTGNRQDGKFGYSDADDTIGYEVIPGDNWINPSDTPTGVADPGDFDFDHDGRHIPKVYLGFVYVLYQEGQPDGSITYHVTRLTGNGFSFTTGHEGNLWFWIADKTGAYGDNDGLCHVGVWLPF